MVQYSFIQPVCDRVRVNYSLVILLNLFHESLNKLNY